MEPTSPYFHVDGDETTDVFPLKETHADVEILGTIARVTLSQTYTNEGESVLNATYFFPASTGAAVSGLTMKIGDRVVKAEIAKKKEAEAKFEKAKSENKSAGLLSQQRPNIFQMKVGHILPGDEIVLTLEYSEMLEAEDGEYEFVLPTAIGPRYGAETAGDLAVKNPFLSEGVRSQTNFSLDLKIDTALPLGALQCDSHDTAIKFSSKNSASLRLDGTQPDRDFILKYKLRQKAISSDLIVHKGEKENYFLLQMEPPAQVKLGDIPSRDYVFLIDISGSMEGFPLNLGKKLMRDLVGSLRPRDTFNVVFFAGGNDVLSKRPLPATKENLAMAVRMLDAQRGGGGTELLAGMKRALALPTERDVSRSLVLITDGFISAEADVFEFIKDGAEGTNIFPLGVGSSVNRHLIEGLAHIAGNDSLVVTHSAETQDAVRRFQASVSSPVLTGLEISGNGVALEALQPESLPDLFENRPLTIVGKWKGGNGGKIRISGVKGDGNTFTKEFSLADAKGKMYHPALPLLWAREKVRSLSDYAQLTGERDIIDEVTKIGLEHELLTPWTSFIAVDTIARKHEGVGKDVTQALDIPVGVSGAAVGGSVPEPSSILMIGLALIATTLLRIR